MNVLGRFRKHSTTTEETKVKLNRSIAQALGAVLICMSGAASAQQEIKVTITAGHAPVLLWVKHLKDTLIPTVNRELAKKNALFLLIGPPRLPPNWF